MPPEIVRRPLLGYRALAYAAQLVMLAIGSESRMPAELDICFAAGDRPAAFRCVKLEQALERGRSIVGLRF